MSEKKGKDGVSALKRFGRWMKRWIFGSKKEYAELELFAIESPGKILKEAFFRKKTAVIALVLLVGLFLFVLIAPMFVSLDVNYTDPLQQNVAPGYSLRNVPTPLKKGVHSIDGFSDFTVGIDLNGRLYVWGNTKNRLQKTDLKIKKVGFF